MGEKNKVVSGSMKGQIGSVVVGLVFVLVAGIVLLLLNTFVTNSSPNFSGILKTIWDNIPVLAGVGVLISVVSIFIGMRLMK